MRARNGRRLVGLLVSGFVLTLALMPPALAQTATPNLADLRADLDAVAADLQGLRAALRVSGATGYASAGGLNAIARMDRMEASLRQLTGAVEEARNHIEERTTEAARRLDDAEFRLCQLEGDCDLAALTTGESLGGGADFVPPAPPTEAAAASAAEQAAFDAALAQAQQGDHRAAAEAFAAFSHQHAGGPLFIEARFLEGGALLALGDDSAASRAFTDVLASAPDGARAPASLLALAQIMAADDQPAPSCQFLSELALRHPDTPEAAQAAPLYGRLSCDSMLDLAPEN